MLKIKKLTKHLQKLHSSVLKNKISLSVLFFILIIVSIFTLTKGLEPHNSELAYIEYSKAGENLGSVVPASCDSGSPHDGQVCGTWVAADCPAWYVCGPTAVSIPYTCQGGNTSPACIGVAPPNKICPLNACPPWVGLSFNGAPAKAPVTSVTLTADRTDIPFGSNATISWNAENATICSVSIGVSTSIQSKKGSYTIPARTDWGVGNISKIVSVQCSNGDSPISSTPLTLTFRGKF